MALGKSVPGLALQNLGSKREWRNMTTHKRSCFKAPSGKLLKGTVCRPDWEEESIMASGRWFDIDCEECLKERPKEFYKPRYQLRMIENEK